MHVKDCGHIDQSSANPVTAQYATRCVCVCGVVKNTLSKGRPFALLKSKVEHACSASAGYL